jgi:hypothetical protein
MPATLSCPALFAVVILVAVPWLQAQQSPSTELKYQVPRHRRQVQRDHRSAEVVETADAEGHHCDRRRAQLPTCHRAADRRSGRRLRAGVEGQPGYAHLSPDYMAASVGKLDGIMGGMLSSGKNEFCLFSRICGRIPVPAVGQVCDRALFPWR